MQKNLPIFLTCSVLALSFNGAVSFAQQSRQMAIPGQASAPVTPPLMIEAGDWDAPAPGTVTGRSLFAEPAVFRQTVAGDLSFAAAAVAAEEIEAGAHGDLRQPVLEGCRAAP